jgi:DNA-directed RNA polymerase subunit L
MRPDSGAHTMELRALTISDKEMEVEVLGENETLLNPIKMKLLEDADVDVAEYVIEHPELSIPRIYFRTKKDAKAPAVFKRTLKALLKDYKDFADAVASQIPEA